MNNFDLKKFLAENKLTANSRAEYVNETLVDADQDMADAILNALGGEAAFEAVVRAMSTDDAKVYLGGIIRDYDIEIEVENNKMVIFPSVIHHSVDEIKMNSQDLNKNLGRYSMVQFGNF